MFLYLISEKYTLFFGDSLETFSVRESGYNMCKDRISFLTQIFSRYLPPTYSQQSANISTNDASQQILNTD